MVDTQELRETVADLTALWGPGDEGSAKLLKCADEIDRLRAALVASDALVQAVREQLGADSRALRELVETLPRCDHEDCAGPDDGTLGAKGKVATHVDEDDMWHYCEEHVPDRESCVLLQTAAITRRLGL